MRKPNPKFARIFRLSQSFTNERLKDSKLTSGLFNYIAALSQEDGQRIGKLSKMVGVDFAHTTRSIRKLAALGYVKKVQDKLDQRSTQVFLTDAGQNIAKIVNQVIIEWVDLITKDVPDNEIEIVDRVFDKFSANAEKYFDQREEVK